MAGELVSKVVVEQGSWAKELGGRGENKERGGRVGNGGSAGQTGKGGRGDVRQGWNKGGTVVVWGFAKDVGGRWCGLYDEER
jgi:hypothetical protein